MAEPSKDTTGAGTAPAPVPAPVAPEQFFASIYPGPDKPLPDSCKEFAKAVLKCEGVYGRPAWVISQNDSGDDDLDSITDELANVIIKSKSQFEKGKAITLILHTVGGNPAAGYKIAIFLQKVTGGFDVLVPNMAKSAGTLMSLGARKLIMGEMSEIGPLDMQVRDTESDLWDSALNETKALQTLSREALMLYMEKMEVLKTMFPRKHFETRNKIATEFVNEMIRPLMEKIDAVHYTKMARIMDVMKMYGKQLMRRAGYPDNRLRSAIEALGENYPEHGYMIDANEARGLGLKVEVPKPDAAECVETMYNNCGSTITIIGRISSSLKT